MAEREPVLLLPSVDVNAKIHRTILFAERRQGLRTLLWVLAFVVGQQKSSVSHAF